MPPTPPAAARFPKEEASFVRRLRARGLRNTPERLEVLRVIFARDSHFAVEDIVGEMRQRGRAVSRATIYRTLAILAADGLIREAVRGNGYIHYERLRSAEHHDHLLCVRCGAVVEFVNPEIERLQEAVCRRHGFTALSHTHQVNGFCARCEGRGARRGPT